LCDFSIIRTIDGKVLHKYKHPAAVFGCDWSQNNKYVISVIRYANRSFLPVLFYLAMTIIINTFSFSLSLLQRYDCHWLWRQECSSLLLGHQFRPATKSLYRSHGQSISCALVTSQRRHTVQWLRWWVIIQFKSQLHS